MFSSCDRAGVFYLLLLVSLLSLCAGIEPANTEDKLAELLSRQDDLNPEGISKELLNIVLDELISGLSENETTCGMEWNALKGLKQNVKVLGKLSFPLSEHALALDSFGKPGAGFFRGNTKYIGSFDECLNIDTKNVNFTMQYCTLPISITIPLAEGVVFPFSFSEAVCLPSSCSLADFNSSLPWINEMLALEHLHVEMKELTSCTDQSGVRYTAGAVIMIVVCFMFLGLTLAATCFDLLLQSHWFVKDHNGSINSVEAKETDSLLALTQVPKSNRYVVLLYDIAKGFSLYTTVPAVLNTKQPPSAITCINGIRVISMFWVMICHTYLFFFELQMFSNNYDILTKFATRYASQPILNGFFSVDSFFFLSGLLVAYLTFRQMERNKGKFPYLPFYVHRILRLTPTYMFVLLFFWFVTVHLGSGPVLNSAVGPDSDQASYCRDYWWTNLLYINNFVPSNFGKECMGWTWYLANDMQFYVISPLLLIPLYFWFPGGLIAIAMTLLSSFAVTGFIAGYYDFTANSFESLLSGKPLNADIPDQSSQIYGKPYCRVTPYLVGILLGFVFYKKYRIPVKKGILGWAVHLGIWGVALVLGLVNVYGLHSTWTGNEFSKAENVTYFMFSRFTWGVTLFLVVYACHYGYGGVINRFLSLPIWVPLSRVTFNAYLLHEMIGLLLFSEIRSTIYYHDASFIFIIIGTNIISYGAAGVVTVFVEFPLSNLEAAVFKMLGKPLHSSARIVERGKRDVSPLEATVRIEN